MLKFPLPEWNTEAILIQNINELPDLFNVNDLYLDLETTSGKDKVSSLNVWKDCKILGIAILVDDAKFPYYIPLRHRGHQVDNNLPIEPVLEWLQKVLLTAKRWINHNIKYDVHVVENEGLKFNGELIDTLVLCKLAPKEERFTYNLTDIMREWFYVDIELYEATIKASLRRGQKDYGLIPIDKMCPYSCVDALSAREIYKQMCTMIPEECSKVTVLEMAVTPVLLDMERTGMKVNFPLLADHYTRLPVKLKVLQEIIQEETGFERMRVHTNADCKQFFVDTYKLPVLEYTEKGAPSFGESALLGYKALCPELGPIIDLMIEYKETYKLFTSFTVPYLTKEINHFVHPDYNQAVRSGRTSCRMPNMQQLSLAAKEYVIPFDKDSVLVVIDYNQIEFRLIAHFIKATIVINAYNEDPKTDYHKFMALQCNIPRTPAKRVNFMLGYGGGRKKCVTVLSSFPEIIGELKTKEAITARANEIYDRFHATLPTLRKTSWDASRVMRQRGYIRTILGRRRYLPYRAHFKSFNTVVQGSAADLFKSALVRIHEHLKDKPHIKLIGAVHDDFVLNMPKEGAEQEIAKLVEIIEEIPEGVNLRVPIKTAVKMSDENWSKCE